MKRALSIAGAALALLLLAGATVYAFANAPEEGSMGVWGYVAAEKNARLELVEEQVGVDTLALDKVVAPEDAWVVVHLDDNGMPGERVGLQHVDKGGSLDVKVALEGVTSEKVIVALHADRGTAGEFDFDMEDKEGSPDRPYFVDGMELAKVVTVR